MIEQLDVFVRKGTSVSTRCFASCFN